MREVADELRMVVSGRVGLLEAGLPALVFGTAGALAGPQAALPAALIASAGLTVRRLARRESVRFPLVGLSVSLLAWLLAVWQGRGEFFFLPDLLANTVLAVVSLVSACLGRPLVAFTSRLMRRWPQDWYWQPRVRPAYAEVTLVWAAYFALLSLIQLAALRHGAPAILAASGLLGGWPATLVLLVISYLYGTWRLARLAGPSVAEFVQHSPPPWEGQRRGF